MGHDRVEYLEMRVEEVRNEVPEPIQVLVRHCGGPSSDEVGQPYLGMLQFYARQLVQHLATEQPLRILHGGSPRRIRGSFLDGNRASKSPVTPKTPSF